MNRKEIVNSIKAEKLVVIIRLKQQEHIPEVVKALVTGGVKVLEITSNTPGYLEEIKRVRDTYPNILVGAGTVINKTLATEAINAGAQFLVTPNTNIDVISVAHENEVPVLMGAVTPTEICNAVEGKADVVKLFPSAAMGIDYFKAVKGPLDTVPFFAVGGIAVENLQEWKDAGTAGFGLGGNLVKPIQSRQDFDGIVALAERVLKIIHS
ncbi:bifunctional 4-hydroxy-2-oxoglutarate aldolase/2-dehydro-3-deoxy-phosphogluconate aldolase [Flavivirga algicola]|uniref:Bifunctional 4-hydroxy-2-oxoglutarate aldolase/2-dehydro-3-deoxy-phosphogluconate aldolase n=1 Tax=Flavivirga algicola TaxID=2729136 RepID=A0ABX1RY04_9FLAO|nr:bifunctional 4-hydroxy-2-oxoglutarate aldolase/2-dehydro-3-deoxy-phosphogluconate aldolase [Flavivirga algicola]NMH88470.1 bifunctional 4-hydroxy-2-oxoglutarate aldolase/2-dehydro-3-deoxy-phosphogluconate aldolase [Flavivirga algicola]